MEVTNVVKRSDWKWILDQFLGKSNWAGSGEDLLKGVQQIQATGYAFAAILEDGSVITWGGSDLGGDSSAVRDQLRGVQQIQATNCPFAAILEDGRWICRYLGCCRDRRW